MPYFVQYSPAIEKIEVHVIPLGIDWMTSIVSYIRNETLPEDCNASRRLKVQSSRFIIMGDVLYKKGFCHPYLRWLTLNEANYVMREVHEGVYGNHLGARSLVQVGTSWILLTRYAEGRPVLCEVM